MDDQKSQFIHSMRNPLNTISVNAELGRLTLERTGDIRKAISIFETILLECRQCSHLLDGLLHTRFIRDEGIPEEKE
jgi:hypothetical protein